MSQNQRLREVSAGDRTATAQLQAAAPGGECQLKIGGDWRLKEPVPAWAKVLGKQMAIKVRVVPEALGYWDTALVLFLVHCRAWCAESKSEFHGDALPANLQTLLGQVPVSRVAKPAAKAATKSSWEWAALVATKWGRQVQQIVAFLGECTLGFMGEAKNPRRFSQAGSPRYAQACWGVHPIGKEHAIA